MLFTFNNNKNLMILIWNVQMSMHGSYPRTFQGLSRTHLPFFKDSIQCKKDLEFYHNIANFILKVFVPFPLGWINKVSTKIQGLFRTDCNFQRISSPWIFCRKFKDFQGECEASLCEELYRLRRVWSTEA